MLELALPLAASEEALGKYNCKRDQNAAAGSDAQGEPHLIAPVCEFVVLICVVGELVVAGDEDALGVDTTFVVLPIIVFSVLEVVSVFPVVFRDWVQLHVQCRAVVSVQARVPILVVELLGYLPLGGCRGHSSQ